MSTEHAPDPALVDRLARVLAEADDCPGDVAGWDDMSEALRDRYRRMVLAVLAALPAPAPDPVGWAVVWGGDRLNRPHIGHHTPVSLRAAQADADDYRTLGTVIPTVVALIPAEDQG